MPYIVITKRPARPGDFHAAMSEAAGIDTDSISRRAVATLEEAQEAAGALMADVLNAHRYEGGPNTSPMVEPEEYDAGDFEDVFKASGGSSGPLPDGTLIEVEPVTWIALHKRAGLPHEAHYSPQAIISIFNAEPSRA